MKKSCWLIALLLVFVLVVGGCSTEQKPAAPEVGVEAEPEKAAPETGGKEEQFTLRFANYFALESGPGKVGQEFCDDIDRLIGGRLNVEYYPGGMLLTAD